MIKPLTSLRFIFALMVFFHHLIFLISKNNQTFLNIYKKIFEEGYTGVGFFFILSGFILTHVYERDIKQGNFNMKLFYAKRFARIYPLHLLTLILWIPLTINLLMKSPLSWTAHFIENSLLIQSFIPIRSHYFSFNFAAWSISNEVFFYLLFPFLIKLLVDFNVKKKIIVFISIFITVIIMMLLVNEDLHHALFYVNPIMRLFDFTIGILIYYFSGYLKKYSKMKATFLEISSIALLVLFLIISSYIPQVFRLSVYYWVPIVYIILIFSTQEGTISEILSLRLFFFLGEISFGFYLFHLVILKYAVYIDNKLNLINSDIILAIIVFFLSILISALSFYYFEKRYNSGIKRWLLSGKSEIYA